jgi:hypothetical protein
MPAEGISPGPRDCHDVQPGRRRVDWIYPNARPRPFALEVTSTVAAVDRSGGDAAIRLGRRLTALAEAEGLGAWILLLRTDRDVRTMEPVVAKILRDAQPIRERLIAADGQIRPGDYTSDDLMRLPSSWWSAYTAEHKRLKELGILELKPISPTERDHVVYVAPGRTDLVETLSPDLREALEAKRQVLGLQNDLERHLGVYVERWDRSNEPEDTNVPEIPPEIDVLWIVHAWKQLFEDDYPVWVVRRGQATWRLYAASGSGRRATDLPPQA